MVTTTRFSSFAQAEMEEESKKAIRRKRLIILAIIRFPPEPVKMKKDAETVPKSKIWLSFVKAETFSYNVL